jgi:hypothetical protein
MRVVPFSYVYIQREAALAPLDRLPIGMERPQIDRLAVDFRLGEGMAGEAPREEHRRPKLRRRLDRVRRIGERVGDRERFRRLSAFHDIDRAIPDRLGDEREAEIGARELRRLVGGRRGASA